VILEHHGESVALLPVAPVAKPRMTRADRWKRRPSVVRYREFADRLREELARHGIEEVAPGGRLRAMFILPMPRSWSKRKRAQMSGRPHTGRPDADNLAKALLDAAMPHAAGGDAAVWKLEVEKRWGGEGAILLWVGSGSQSVN